MTPRGLELESPKQGQRVRIAKDRNVQLRKTRPDLKRAFRCPGVPVIPALAVIFCVMLMTYLSSFTWIAFVIWLVIGLAIYFLYGKSHSKLGKAEARM